MEHVWGIDIVIVNHRTPLDLGDCLDAIQAYPPAGPFTVSVGHSAVQNADVAAVAQFDGRLQVDEFTWERNVGYNVACNTVGAAGNHELIAFLNADARPTPRAFDVLGEALWRHPERAMVGPRQVDRHGNITAGGTLGTNEAPALRSFQRPDDGVTCCEVRDDAVYVSGSFLVMRRDVFITLTACPIYQKLVDDQPGPWGDFAHYEGDAWLGYHARAHDYVCTYFGLVRCFHDWHRASPRGGYGEAMGRQDHLRFQELCDAHGIAHN